jgi:hypothetical protein
MALVDYRRPICRRPASAVHKALLALAFGGHKSAFNSAAQRHICYDVTCFYSMDVF